jgi:hypothetical protein
MTANKFPQRALNFLIPVFGTACIIVPILIGLAHPQDMQTSDFLMTFYPAGKLLLDNRAVDLYPALSSSSFVESPFNIYTHQMLNALPPDFAASYMYSPLTAAIFVPFSLYTPAIALLCWQLVSLVALTVCAKLLSSLTGTRTLTTLFLFVLFFPVIQTIFIGQLGILLGLLPLTIGYYLLVQKRELAAGLVWSTFILKPQYLLIAVFVALVLSSQKRFRCLIGLTTGLALFFAYALCIFGAQVLELWLHSLQLAGEIESSPNYGYAAYLKCSLLPAALSFLPAPQRPMLGPALNLLSCLIAAHGIWTAMNFLNKGNSENEKEQITIIFLIGLLLIPLFLPHFFYYDFCLFAIAGTLLLTKMAPLDSAMRWQTITAWLIIDLYLIIWTFVNPALAQPLIVVLIDAFLYWRVLHCAMHLSSQAKALPVSPEKLNKTPE